MRSIRWRSMLSSSSRSASSRSWCGREARGSGRRAACGGAAFSAACGGAAMCRVACTTGTTAGTTAAWRAVRRACLRILREPVAPLGLQGLLVSSAPRLCQLVGVVAILSTHRRQVSDAADPPRREQRRRTGVQAGGASQAKHQGGDLQLHPFCESWCRRRSRAPTGRLKLLVFSAPRQPPPLTYHKVELPFSRR